MKLANKYVDAEGKVMYIKGQPDPSRLNHLEMKEAFGAKAVIKDGITFIAPFKEEN
jgi:hypothetical protein